jgi:hypothetical protein
MFILKRENAEKDYSEIQSEKAKNRFESMTLEEKTKLVENIICGLPGRTSEAYTMTKFTEAVKVKANMIWARRVYIIRWDFNEFFMFHVFLPASEALRVYFLLCCSCSCSCSC